MRIAIPPPHRLSVEPGPEWIADDMDPRTVAAHGAYVRSVEHGVYLNVRAQEAGANLLTASGLRALLREQGWASPPFDEWVLDGEPGIVVGGTFETVGMAGEVVLEILVTDGRVVANLAGPGERAVIAAVTASAQRLARSVRFG